MTADGHGTLCSSGKVHILAIGAAGIRLPTIGIVRPHGTFTVGVALPYPIAEESATEDELVAHHLYHIFHAGRGFGIKGSNQVTRNVDGVGINQHVLTGVKRADVGEVHGKVTEAGQLAVEIYVCLGGRGPRHVDIKRSQGQHLLAHLGGQYQLRGLCNGKSQTGSRRNAVINSHRAARERELIKLYG